MTKTTSTTPPLAWDYAARDVPEAGLDGQLRAGAEELARVAQALDLLACSRLTADFAVMPAGAGCYRLSGTVSAEIEQACVVTLEPLASTIEEPFDVTFWPENAMPVPPGGELDLDEEPDPEALIGGQIAVGRVVFECLAAAIDPFPRKPGATLDWKPQAPKGEDAGRSQSPFAILATIRGKGR
jgi:hypothetical protein